MNNEICSIMHAKPHSDNSHVRKTLRWFALRLYFRPTYLNASAQNEWNKSWKAIKSHSKQQLKGKNCYCFMKTDRDIISQNFLFHHKQVPRSCAN